jgi:drug/metabolite transporter (DMT)-like permease
VSDAVIPQPGLPGSRRHSYRGEILALIGSLLFAVNGGVAKIILNEGMPAARMTELRSLGAFIVLFFYLLMRNPKALRLTRSQLPYLIVYGVAGFAAVQMFYFLTISRLPVGVGLLFEYTAPVLLVLWARFVKKERVRARMWIALLFALTGLALVANVIQGVTLDRLGVMFGIIAAFSLAGYYLLGQRGVRMRDPISLTTYGFLFSTLFWLIVMPIWTFPWEIMTRDLPVGGDISDAVAPGWTLMTYVVLLGTIAPFLLVITALKYTTPARAGMIGMLEPVAASAVTWVWLGESLSMIQVLGGVIVLIGIGLAETARN